MSLMQGTLKIMFISLCKYTTGRLSVTAEHRHQNAAAGGSLLTRSDLVTLKRNKRVQKLHY